MINFGIYFSGAYGIEPFDCVAEKGMTWGEWIDSDYNTFGVTSSHRNISGGNPLL